jgi:RNA 3'-terminal phosphate cyclase (ATP)
METIHIDGSFGEGGGQVLRTSLTLAAITGKHLRINNIRASRPNPGLAKQHLACVEAARAICNARCSGAELRSTTLDFTPQAVRPGEYHFDIGSAGSASLVVQTILPVLFTAEDVSTVTVTGGTHNPWAPPFDFLKETFLPAIAGMGFKAECRLLRYGFFPAGGGKIVFEVQPFDDAPPTTTFEGRQGRPIDLFKAMVEPKIYAVVYTSKLPNRVVQRQRRLIAESGLPIAGFEHIEVTDSAGPGNCVVLRIVGANRTSVFTGFGSKGKPSEKVIAEVVEQVTAFLESGAAIDHYLADQLLIYMAMQKSGCLTTSQLSRHLTTNMEVIKKFLPVDFVVEQENNYFRMCCV